MLDFSRCRLPPFAHQREDVQALLEHPYFAIFSEMRTGKSKIVVDAAQFLFESGVIERMIVVAPAPVRDVWYDPQLGELAKHVWNGFPMVVNEYHARHRHWLHTVEGIERGGRRLEVFVTNFEFLRAKARLVELLAVCGPKTLLVLDESSFVKNYAAQQTKACMQLRRACGRVVLLNGTPLFHSPLDLFSQGNLLSPTILDCKYVTYFKSRYSVQAPVMSHGGRALTNAWGKPITKVERWINLDDLQRRFAPVTVRRLQKDCLDLPPKLDPVTLTATLSPESWKTYCEMRDQMVVWLQSGDVVTSATAAIKALRLSQITSGFLGGVEAANIEPVDADLLTQIDLPGSFLDGLQLQPSGSRALQEQAEYFNDVIGTMPKAQEIGRDKLDVLLWFIEQRLEADPNLHFVAWGRFRAEVLRAEVEVKSRFPQFETAVVLGGQKKAERLRALALLKPETSPSGPVFVAGIEGTGSFGLGT